MEFHGLQQLRGVISPASLAVSQHDYNPARLAYASVLRQSATADVSITGMVPRPGQVLRVFNVAAAAKITLANQSAASAAANRFAFGRDLVLLPDDAVTIWYDDTSTRWRLIDGIGRLPAFEAQTEEPDDFDPFADFLTVYDTSAVAVRKISPRLPLLGGRNFNIGEADFCGTGQFQDWYDGVGLSVNSANRAEPNHPGVQEYGFETGWAGAAVPNVYSFKLGGGRLAMMAIIKTGPDLSSPTERYVLHTGLHHDDHTVDPGFGLLVRYSDDVNGGRWQLRASSDDNETLADTGVLVTADTWYRIEIDVNADASVAVARVNGGPLASVAANIPSNDLQMIGCEMVKPGGSERRNFYIDYAGYIQAFAVKR